MRTFRSLMALIPVAVALLALTSCEVPSPEPPAPVQEPAACEPDAKDDVAKAPKPLAEAILGKWKQVKTAGRPTWSELELTHEYKKNGVLIIESNDPKHGHHLEIGTYKIERDRIHYNFESRKPDSTKWTVTIQEITGTKVVITTNDTIPGEEAELKKIDVHKPL